MKKLITGAVLLGAASTASAVAPGGPNCGWGNMLFAGQSGIVYHGPDHAGQTLGMTASDHGALISEHAILTALMHCGGAKDCRTVDSECEHVEIPPGPVRHRREIALPKILAQLTAFGKKIRQVLLAAAGVEDTVPAMPQGRNLQTASTSRTSGTK